MATPRRQKEAMRSALFAYIAGIHYLIEEVERLREELDAESATSKRHEFLEHTYKSALESKTVFDLFIDTLEEEELYPFGNNWPREEMFELMTKIIPPAFSRGREVQYAFRFKRGFKDILLDLSYTLESHMKASQMLDHWLVALINACFYAGASLAPKVSEQTKIFYDAIDEIEIEDEPWSKYTQIANLLDKQLRRETKRKTGLVNLMDYDS